MAVRRSTKPGPRDAVCAVRRRHRRHQRLRRRGHRSLPQAPEPHRHAVRAAAHGIVGALTEDLIDAEPRKTAATIAGAAPHARRRLRLARASSSRSSSRIAPKYERLIEVFRAHDIGYFFYNGGNDSMDTALKVSQIGAQLGYPHRLHRRPEDRRQRPAVTDCCPGFGSVAKYVAVSTREAALDVASMARTSTARLRHSEVMGRHAGWIAAAGGLAARKGRRSRRTSSCFRRSPSGAVPRARERKPSIRKGCCVIVASEGK